MGCEFEVWERSSGLIRGIEADIYQIRTRRCPQFSNSDIEIQYL
jgi:hypothetical protein